MTKQEIEALKKLGITVPGYEEFNKHLEDIGIPAHKRPGYNADEADDDIDGTVHYSSLYLCSEHSPTRMLIFNIDGDSITIRPAKGVDKEEDLITFELDNINSEALGKQVYVSEGFFNYFENDEDGELPSLDVSNSGTMYCDSSRLVEIEPSVFLLYSCFQPERGNNGLIGFENPKLDIVFAESETIVKKWVNKGQKAIEALEDSLYKQLFKTKTNKIKMPKEGELHTPELAEKIEQLLVKQLGGEGGTIQKIVLVDDDWSMIRHELTGVLLGRYTNVVFAESHPEHPEGMCHIFVARIAQEYNGVGFSNKLIYDGVSSNSGYGTYIPTENLDL